jgi:dipeptidase
MKKAISVFTMMLFAGVLSFQKSEACTNFLVTRGASATGSTLISYSADSHVLYGELYFWPAKDYPQGTMLDVYEWDTRRYMGKIKQVSHTYSVIGNMNEHQLAIGETTFGGAPLQPDTTAIIDYGSLIYITLQRSKNAREAIKTISELVTEYGYASSGESFSIADGNEVWIFEIVGKGKSGRGAAWVARRIPEGYVCGHANHARISTFPLATGKKNSVAITSKDWKRLMDPTVECIYAWDVIDVARVNNLFSGKNEEFSFCDTFAPISFESARACEARVWSFFKSVNKDMDQYFSYASGHDLKNRMPLWIKPDRKLSNLDLMNFMRDHFEGTALDMRKDVGAGPFGLPYRWRPLSWKIPGDSDAKEYVNERATATQQTGFVFVAEGRNWLPNPVGGVYWFGVDDAATTVFTPFYCGMNEVPENYKTGNGDLLTYSPTSAFWIFNQVANFCYLRYDRMSQDAIKVQKELETGYATEIQKSDKEAEKLFATDEKAARQYITDCSLKSAANTFSRWKRLSEYLLVKYMDGNIKKEKDGKFLRNEYGNPAMPEWPGYPDWWKKSVIEDTGDKLLVPKEKGN